MISWSLTMLFSIIRAGKAAVWTAPCGQLEQGSFFTLEHSHEVLSRLTIQLLGSLVTNDDGRFATFGADTLFRRTGHDLFYPGQLRRQRLTTSGTLPAVALVLERQLQLGAVRF